MSFPRITYGVVSRTYRVRTLKAAQLDIIERYLLFYYGYMQDYVGKVNNTLNSCT